MYKFVLPLFISIILLSPLSLAQTIDISYADINYEESVFPSVKAIMKAPADEVRDGWVDFMKNQTDVRFKGDGLFANKDVLYAEEVQIESISDRTLDLYAKIVSDAERTVVHVFGAFGYDIPISKANHPQAFSEMHGLLKKFSKSFLNDYYGKKIEETRETIADLNAEHVDFQEEIQDNQEEIEKLRKENEDLRNAISENREKLDALQFDLSDLEGSLSEVRAYFNTLR